MNFAHINEKQYLCRRKSAEHAENPEQSTQKRYTIEWYVVGIVAALVILIAVVALVLVPFVLAFLLELTNKQGAVCALKSAGSATAAYLADTCLKLAVFIYAIYAIFQF